MQDRLQCIRDHVSSCQKVCLGVPRGSVLGPLLFLLYTVLFSFVNYSSVYSFADDTQLAHKFSVANVRRTGVLLNGDIASVWKFLSDHNLPMKPTKSTITIPYQ